MRFGPAGFPEESKAEIKKVFEILREVGLDALEYAAVFGLRMKEERARLIGEYSAASDVVMSMHAAYYINLASKSESTRERSKQRLVKALKYAPLMNVRRIVFHPGTYGGLRQEEAFNVIKNALKDVWHEAGHQGSGALLAPEIAGKLNAFGSLDELIRICSEVEGCIPTIDWAHLHARTQGRCKNRKSYLSILEKLEIALGDLFTKNMHFHISGILYTKVGEKAHRPLGTKWGPDILPLLEIVNEVGYTPTFISETPEPVVGALYAKVLFEELEKAKQ